MTDLQDQLLDGAGLEGFIRPGLDLDSIPEPVLLNNTQEN